MRIIAGACRGRTLKPPTWQGLRPTSDRLRGTLFNVLAPRIQGARLLDVYAGTGAVGIEALSRGAAQVTFIDSDRRAAALIADNLARCAIAEGYAIIRASAARAMETLRRSPSFVPFDIIALDPPYDCEAAEALAGVETLLAAGGLVVFEHARRAPVPQVLGPLALTRDLVSGDSALAFYACRP